MWAQRMLVAGAAIYGVLGLLHLRATLFGDGFEARDAAVTEAMKRTSPRLTGRTTVWDAWIGFNASHSLGAILLSAFVVLLATRRMDVIESEPLVLALVLAASLSYVAIGIRYWFRIPIAGICLATALFVGAAASIWS